MTLDEAIAHAKEAGLKMVSNKDTHDCGLEHLQLASWLEELRSYKLKDHIHAMHHTIVHH